MIQSITEESNSVHFIRQNNIVNVRHIGKVEQKLALIIIIYMEVNELIIVVILLVVLLQDPQMIYHHLQSI